MRKSIPVILLSALIALAACGGGDKKDNKPKQTGDLSSNPDYTAGLALVSKSDCFTCHRTAGKLTGPAYEDVAAKYGSDASDKKIEELANTIIKGVEPGQGNWNTGMKMNEHASLTLDDAKKMVKYILLLKKQ